MNKKNIWSEKAAMSYLQIMILIIASFAFSYIIYESTRVGAEEIENIALNTCLKDKEGAWCQEYVSTKCDEKCEEKCFPGRKTDYSECGGCCYNPDEGVCILDTARLSCEEFGGKWKKEACDFNECEKGCCVLGNQAKFVTERECKKQGELKNLEGIFHQDIKTEVECIFLVERGDEGACVFEQEFETTCKFTTREECKILDGGFHKNYLCSNEELETDCEKQEHTGCVEGMDGVYWFDSCGNRENIYSSNKIESWNKGFILEKEDSCKLKENLKNVNSCGNCDHFYGSICGSYRAGRDIKPDEGDYVCRDLSCKNAPYIVDASGKILETKDRKNGESWCVYDGFVGEGRDVVGSRHFRYICYMGEVKQEPCADFRNEICIQEDIDLEKGKFSSAACRINRWQMCIDANTKEEGQKTNICEENSDCFVKNIFVDKGFNFNVCSPKYPSGFDMGGEGSEKSAEAICSMASQTCTVVYVKTKSGWKCEANCNCEKPIFTQQMNDFCSSLGDCGGYVNIVEKTTDYGYSVFGSPLIDLNQYKKYANPVKGQIAEPGDISEFTGYLGIPEGLGEAGEIEEKGISNGFLLGAVGAGGVAVLTGILTSPSIAYGLKIATIDLFTGAVGSGFARAGMAVAIGAIVGLMVAKMFGLKGDSVLVTVVVAVGFAGLAAAGVPFATLGLEAGAWAGPLGALIGALIGALLSKFLGWGKTKKKIVKFTCLPWQAPFGGNDCEFCNKGEKPCSEYRCQSLGQACEFINAGTDNELCFWNNRNDAAAPKISPLFGIITKGFIYNDIKDSGFQIKNLDDEKGCVPAFTPLTFGISTNEPASCKLDSVHTSRFDEMEEYFGGSNLLLYNHTMQFSLPSVESLANQYNVTSEFVLEKYGDLNFYVRCKDANGNENTAEYTIKMCVKPEPDITAPYIRDTEPKNGKYIEYSAKEKDITIWTNEPAECKWDIENKDFETLENSMDCVVDIEELQGYKCIFKLTDIKTGENNIFIRCKDKPWEEDESKRFVMEKAYEYILKTSESELKIDYMQPEGEIYSGTTLTTINIEVGTSGGAENGKAHCRWGVEEGNYISDFQETFSNIHKQSLTDRDARKYKIFIKCEDVAGNEAEDSTSFELIVDDDAPKVVRAYYDSGLKIITNEDAECAYSTEDCNFYVGDENSTSMGGVGREHSADWNNLIYYIRCKDDYGNEACVMKIRAYELV